MPQLLDQLMADGLTEFKKLCHLLALIQSGVLAESEKPSSDAIVKTLTLAGKSMGDLEKRVQRQMHVIAYYRITNDIAEAEAESATLLIAVTDAKRAAEDRHTSEKDRPRLVVEYEKAVERYQAVLFLKRTLNESLRDAVVAVEKHDDPNPIRRIQVGGANGSR
jgi:hypothetical protein